MQDATWMAVTQQQVRELERVRRMMSYSLRQLKRHIREQRGLKEQESCFAEMAKLTQLQMKLIPLEQKLRQEMQAAQQDGQSTLPSLSDDDWQVLEEALKRRRQAAEKPSAGTSSAGEE